MAKMFNVKIFSQKKEIFGLIGAGGQGREIMPTNDRFELVGADRRIHKVSKQYFVDSSITSAEVNQVENLSEANFLGELSHRKYFNVAIADSVLREKAAGRLIGSGIKPLSLISKSSQIHPNSVFEEGAIFCASTILQANARVGRFLHANMFSYIAHDCVLGDFVTLAPRVSCNGNVVIGDHAYIGTSAMIKQGTKKNPIYIGRSSIVGMGAVVTKDVPDFAVVVGNPARVIRYTNQE
jgi:sugar O-acyltransferase (sialic acid O-acetyltransferase NeuD family)